MRVLWFISCLCTFVLSSCDRPACTNTNPIFNQYALRDELYKAELAMQIESIGADKLSYWVGYYNKKGHKTYTSVYVQGNGLCALMELDISSGEGWQDYKMARGMSYNGTRILRLKYHISHDTDGTHFIFDSMNMLLD